MNTEMKAPNLLYKYRMFTAQTVDQLCLDQLYFADPLYFNDPLDTKPCVEVDEDCNLEVLRRTVTAMINNRCISELSVAAKSIKYFGPKTTAQIEKISASNVKLVLEDAEYAATDPDSGIPEAEALRWELAQIIENELLRQYDKGVVSLAERFDCPLMWSHYGDQHRGICIGFRPPQEAISELQEVIYGGDRKVSAKDVAALVLHGDALARDRVDKAVLFKKAEDWSYEKEWRLIGPKGSIDSALDFAEIVFGMRCPDTVKYALIQTFEKRKRPPEFFEINPVRGTFRLDRKEVDKDELKSRFPRNARSEIEEFSDLLESASRSSP